MFDDDGVTPLPIANWGIRFTLKTHPTNAAALLSKTATVTNAAQGRYEVHVSHFETLSIRSGDYAYDTQCVDSGGERVMSIGRCAVRQEVLYP